MFHVSSWIWHQHTPNIMNIIFGIKTFNYFMHLQFKFEVCKKFNETKNNKIYQKVKIVPNVNKEF